MNPQQIIVPNTSSSSLSSLSLSNATQYLSVKLTSSNYLLWQAQMMPLLNGHNHIAPHAAPPPQTLTDNTPNPEYISWYRQDQLVLSWLLCSISETLLPQIIGLQTAKEAWQKLATIFSSGSRTQIQQLQKQLKHLRKGSDSVDVYMQSK